MGYRVERWCVQPQELPRVGRHCSGCNSSSEFVCSQKFRVNAQKKVIDVWLIYRCEACEATWNLPIVSRCSVTAMDAERRLAYERNDPRMAWTCAFDLENLGRYCSRLEFGDSIVVDRSEVPVPNEFMRRRGTLSGDTIFLDVDYACAWRLDRLLASELGLSRNRLLSLEKAGRIVVRPECRKPLRKIVRGNVEIVFVGLGVLGE